MSNDESSLDYATDGLANQIASDFGANGHDSVSLRLEVDGLGGPLQVRHVELVERLNQLSTCSVSFRCTERPHARELLRKECVLGVLRSEQRRTFKGIVTDARVSENVEGVEIDLVFAPAFWYLSQMVASRIHQDTTVPDLVETLVGELLGDLRRGIRNDTSASYKKHEYLVQYQESYFDFLNRLSEQEGIFWFFDHEKDGNEVLVLVDSVSGLPEARCGHGKNDRTVPFVGLAGHSGSVEVVHTVEHEERVGPTDLVISGYDWTRPKVTIGAKQVKRLDARPALEIYEHTDATTYHDYDEPAYGSDTAGLQAHMRAELLDLGRERWSMDATFVGARPGHLFELTNHQGGLAGRYLIVSSTSTGSAAGDSTGAYSSHLECVPTSLRYRPERRTPRPVIAGFESATVVTDGREIQTDVHGRVKVQFHWDRQGQNDDTSSCWIRVIQSWAGDGFGTMFIPRRGMEVIVGFLGGNPDQPIIAGCVYNGANHAPATLDANKTQSVIRTKSSPKSDGYNELRFEDSAGQERIHIHAEKDFDEVVEHDHTTHVKNCQTNTVDVNQTETIGRNQTLHVKHDRKKTVDNDEVNVIQNNRTTTIKNDEKLTVEKGERVVSVQTGADNEEYLGGRHTKVEKVDDLVVAGGADKTTHVTGNYLVRVDGQYALSQGGGNKIVVDDKIDATTQGAIALDSGGGAGRVRLHENGVIELDTDREIVLRVLGTTLRVHSGGVEINGMSINVTADGMMQLQGGIVKIN